MLLTYENGTTYNNTCGNKTRSVSIIFVCGKNTVRKPLFCVLLSWRRGNKKWMSCSVYKRNLEHRTRSLKHLIPWRCISLVLFLGYI
jgi:hypothetical protein